MPKRIQRKRTKGFRLPPGCVYVGRPSRWGNSFTDADGTVEERVMLYGREMDWLRENNFEYYKSLLAPLRGKDLACWCSLDDPCHADVLLELCAELDGKDK